MGKTIKQNILKISAIVHVIPLILLIGIFVRITFFMPQVDEIMIYSYKSLCLESMHIYAFTKEEIWGTLLVHFGENIRACNTVFYFGYIKNPVIIKEFLDDLDWKAIISENHFNLSIIDELVKEKYNVYIEQLEISYNRTIITRESILSANNTLMRYLYEYINSL